MSIKSYGAAPEGKEVTNDELVYHGASILNRRATRAMLEGQWGIYEFADVWH